MHILLGTVTRQFHSPVESCPIYKCITGVIQVLRKGGEGSNIIYDVAMTLVACLK